MVTMLDCINRVPSIVEKIIANRDTTFCAFRKAIAGKEITGIYFVGSGTSNTSAQTSVRFAEVASGVSCEAMIPNPFLAKVAYNPNAIYVFTSQSGTSTLTQAALKKVKDMGCLTVAITGKEHTPLDNEADVWVDMGCGFEEYGMRTIGYCSSVLTQMLLGMEVGKARGYLSEECYNAYIEDACKVPASHKAISEKTMVWFDKYKDVLNGGTDIILYGPGSLYGVALEGALKILETAKRFISVGYEMDDGLHGPTMGFTKDHIVITLSDGGKDDKLVQGVSTMMKKEFNGHGFIVGRNTQDETDLAFEPASKNFIAIEYAPVVQIIAYRLAADFGVPVPPMAEMMADNKPRYFNTHDADKPEQ
ncbi:MAG: SIS domain-containing protein [Erysipelotrichaceae bacterium]|nr:SIS domain-containing protein [Erysipelotrichaceae bacterium]